MEPGAAVRAAADSGDYGAVIRLCRRERGWSQGHLGRLCGYSQSAISRLERGRCRFDVPTLRTVAQALDIPLHMVGLGEPAAVNRREFIGGALATVASTKLPRVPSEAADYFTDQLTGHWRADRALGPHLLLETVTQQTRTVVRAAAATRGQLHKDLLGIATAYSGLVGWLHQDAGDLPACERWLSETLELAHRSGDPELVAYALTCRAMVRNDMGDGLGAVDLADAAIAAAPALGAKAKAMAFQQAALGYALLDDRAAVDHRLDEMALALDQAQQRAYGGDRLDDRAVTIARCRATCYGRLGLGAESVALWAQVGIPTDDRRDAGVYLARHAAALLDAHQPDQAADLAAQGVGYLHETGSARMRVELSNLRTKAATWATTQPGRELVDLLAAV